MAERQTTTGELDIRLSGIAADVAGLKHTLYGNGDEGLKTTVIKMQGTLERLTDLAEDAQDEKRELRKIVYGAVASIVVALVLAVVTALWSASRQSQIESIVEAAVVRIERAQSAAASPGRTP